MEARVNCEMRTVWWNVKYADKNSIGCKEIDLDFVLETRYILVFSCCGIVFWAKYLLHVNVAECFQDFLVKEENKWSNIVHIYHGFLGWHFPSSTMHPIYVGCDEHVMRLSYSPDLNPVDFLGPMESFVYEMLMESVEYVT